MKKVSWLATSLLVANFVKADPFRHLFDPWADLSQPATSAPGRPPQALSRAERWKTYAAWGEAQSRMDRLALASSACAPADRDVIVEVARRARERLARFEAKCLHQEGPNECSDDKFRLGEFDHALEDFESIVASCSPAVPSRRLYPRALNLEAGTVADLILQGSDVRPDLGGRIYGAWSGLLRESAGLSASIEARGAYLRQSSLALTPYDTKADLAWASSTGKQIALEARAARADTSFAKAGADHQQILDEYGGGLSAVLPEWARMRLRYGAAQRLSSGDSYTGLRHQAMLGFLDRIRFDGTFFVAKAGALESSWRALRFAVISGPETDALRTEFGAEERRSAGGSYVQLHPSCMLSYRAKPFRGVGWGGTSMIGDPRFSGSLTASLRPEDDAWSVGGTAFRIASSFTLEWERWVVDMGAGSFVNQHRGGPGPDAWESGFSFEITPRWNFAPHWRADGFLGLRRSSMSLAGAPVRLWSDGFGSTRLGVGVGATYVFAR